MVDESSVAGVKKPLRYSCLHSLVRPNSMVLCLCINDEREWTCWWFQGTTTEVLLCSSSSLGLYMQIKLSLCWKCCCQYGRCSMYKHTQWWRRTLRHKVNDIISVPSTLAQTVTILVCPVRISAGRQDILSKIVLVFLSPYHLMPG
jgi:hypothetical protein